MACLAALLCVLALPAFAAARPGSLDRGFGTNGRVATAVDQVVPWTHVNTHVARTPNDGIVVASDQKIARYGPDGQLDTSFGSGGFATVGYPEGLTFVLRDLEVDSAGRVTLIGTGNIPVELPATKVYPRRLVRPTFAMVVRFQANGAPDPQFGEDGVVWTDFGIPTPSDYYDASAVELGPGAVDATGRVIVIVGIQQAGPAYLSKSPLKRVDSWIMRLGLDGELDPSFGGGDGIAELSGIEQVADMALDPSGRIVLAASVPVSRKESPLTVFFRHAENGALDPTYGTKLRIRGIRGPQEIALDRRGRLVAMGEPESVGKKGRIESPFWRLTPSGKPDRGFGRRGRAAASLPEAKYGYEPQGLRSFALDRRGRILTAGTFGVVVKKKGPIYKRTRGRFTAVRLTTSGKPDRRFGKRGWVITRFGRRSDAIAKAAMVDARGRLVVAGTATRPDLEPTGGFALARYLGR